MHRCWRVSMSDYPNSPIPVSATESVQRSRDSQDIEKCWRALQNATSVPLRSQITPSAISPRLLAGIGLCGFRIVDGRMEGRYRLAGSRFRQLTGVELTGATFQDIVRNGAVDMRSSILRRVLDYPAGVWWVSEVAFGDMYVLPYQSTILPLCSIPAGLPDHIIDFVECEVPIAASNMRGILSDRILKHRWIDLGWGVPQEAGEE